MPPAARWPSSMRRRPSTTTSMENDHTPGFISAAEFVAGAFLSVDLDFRALPGIYVGIVMGRHAGFLTAASAAWRLDDDSGPHLIYVPERAFSVPRFIDDVQRHAGPAQALHRRRVGRRADRRRHVAGRKHRRPGQGRARRAWQRQAVGQRPEPRLRDTRWPRACRASAPASMRWATCRAARSPPSARSTSRRRSMPAPSRSEAAAQGGGSVALQFDGEQDGDEDRAAVGRRRPRRGTCRRTISTPSGTALSEQGHGLYEAAGAEEIRRRQALRLKPASPPWLKRHPSPRQQYPGRRPGWRHWLYVNLHTRRLAAARPVAAQQGDRRDHPRWRSTVAIVRASQTLLRGHEDLFRCAEIVFAVIFSAEYPAGYGRSPKTRPMAAAGAAGCATC